MEPRNRETPPPGAASGQAEPLPPERLHQLLWGFLLLGLAARVIRYALKFPLWDDECFLLANLLDRDYADLAKPLDYWQICPIGFLWLELALSRLLGFSEYVLRLPSLVASVAGLFVFRHLAGRLLRGTALVLAVGTFAVAYPLLRYSAEAKPYGLDLFLAVLLLALAVEWWHRGATESRWLWALTAVVPPAMLLSYPIVFVAGGVSLFVAYVLWRRGGWDGWPVWVAYNLALLGVFVVVLVYSVRPQSAAALASMREYWDRGFPPWRDPLALVAWFFKVHTGQMLAYPIGDNHGGSTLTFLLVVVGIATLARRRQGAILLLFLAPAGLTFLAAVLGRYPYGGMVRFNIYLGPILCLLVGLGLAVVLVPRRPRATGQGRAGLLVAAAVLMVVALGSIARDVAFPAKNAVDMRYRDFARWFWFDMAQDGEVVCLTTDLGKTFSEKTLQGGFSAMYLCNQRIYSPRHARGEPPDWGRVSAEWPLRCVLFRSSEYVMDEASLSRWLVSMQERYTLVARERLPFVCHDKWRTRIRAVTYVELFKFVPRAGEAPGPPA